jgi:nucleotide-binding universal stress UspA family protein
MFERILLPLDGSELAEAALPYGQELARKLSSELILFHVCEPGHHQQEHMHKVYLNSLAENVRRNLKRGQPQGTETKVTTKIETGGPQENICTLVGNNGIGLIVMTAVGASGLKVGKMIGSVADHICRTVPIPVMLIRPQSTQRIGGRKQLINRLLLTLDGSNLSKLVLPVGEELAAKLKVPITLFQMAHMIIPWASDGMAPDAIPSLNYTKLSEDEEKRVRAEMVALEEKLRLKELNVTHIVNSGFSAADEIIEAGKKVGADLVVISTHGRSGLGRWVMGSVAEKVLRHSEIPVLLVNARAG